jgi:phage tail sheath protein FI
MPSFITGAAVPGVHASVNTSLIGAPVQPGASDALFSVTYSAWGPVNVAKTVTGIADLTRQFGGLNANSHGINSLHNFFRQGGRRAWVVRVVGAAAAVATATLNDRAGVPVATVRVDARYPSSTVDVRRKVETGSTANTVKLTFRSVKLNVIEVFDNFKLTFTQQEIDDINAGRSVLTRIQDVNDRSQLVKLTDLASATAAPNNLPALAAEAVLAGGNDDFAGITDATFIGADNGLEKTGLHVFNSEEFGTGQVALHGVTTQAAHAALIAHAETYKRFALPDPAFGDDRDEVVAARKLHGSPYAAIYWPWVEQLDLEGTGVRKFYPPSGFVAGIFARAENEVGVHKAPANYLVRGVLDVERAPNGSPQVDEATRAFLNRNEVNVIAPLQEQGIKVYGARVMMSFGRVTAVHQQRILNRIYYDLKPAYQELPFATYDAEGRVFRVAASVSEQYLRLLYRSGALTSTTGREEDAFKVICDSSNNPPETIDQKQLYVDVYVHLVEMVEMVLLSINNVPLATSLAAFQE